MKVSKLMESYFNDLEYSEDSKKVMSESTLICEVKEHIKNRWITVSNPERLHCRFEFSDYYIQSKFVERLMAYQGAKNHHAKIICDESFVIVEVYTKSLGCITEIDISYSEDVMSIYNNLKNYMVV